MISCLFRGYIPSIVRVDDRLPGALHPSTHDLDKLELEFEFVPPLRWCIVLDVAMIDRMTNMYLDSLSNEFYAFDMSSL
jgi:hypothetical protein